MTKKKLRIIITCLLMSVLILPFSSPTAKAKPLYASTATYPYYISSSSAKAASYNTNVIENQTLMKCLHDSWTDPAVTINVIGFTWVACTVKCRRSDGTDYIYDQRSWNPGYITGSSNHALEMLPKACSGGLTTIWVTESWHDFNHTGSPVWRPSTNYYSTHY